MSQIRRAKVVSAGRIQQGHAKASKRVYPEGLYGATLRRLRIAPNKVRLVVNQIRGESVNRARETLRYSHKRAAYYLDRVILSALGNADAKSAGAVGADNLYVMEAYCDEGPRFRRFKAGPMGRGRPIIRRSCHLTVVLGRKEED